MRSRHLHILGATSASGWPPQDAESEDRFQCLHLFRKGLPPKVGGSRLRQVLLGLVIAKQPFRENMFQAACSWSDCSLTSFRGVSGRLHFAESPGLSPIQKGLASQACGMSILPSTWTYLKSLFGESPSQKKKTCLQVSPR